MADKIYVGNGKSFKFDNGGETVRIVVDLDSLIREFDNHGWTTDQGKRKIKLNVTERRNVDSYGNTHGVEVDTWKPDNQNSNFQADNNQPPPSNRNFPPPPPLPSGGSFEDDVPF